MATFFISRSAGRKKLIRNIILLLPGVAGHFVIHSGLIRNDFLHILINRLDVVYIVVVSILISNSILMLFLEAYSRTDRNKSRPIKGFIQAIQATLMFIGGIISVAVLIDKSPTALLTGLGASAAILMLIFKDSILGFVAGVQLTQNDMIQIGDWIQMPDGSANGTIEEITLNTVKVRNWDNTISTIPPYTLVSTSFKNWRGMQESGGRRVDKMIFIDMSTLKTCSQNMISDIRNTIPLMKDVNIPKIPTNSCMFRIYIEKYLRQHPMVAQDLDLIIAQRQPGEFGLPIEVYFFITEKKWHEYETIQSDIFDHLLAMAHKFDLNLYQLPSRFAENS